jgi:hypothetical protein
MLCWTVCNSEFDITQRYGNHKYKYIITLKLNKLQRIIRKETFLLYCETTAALGNTDSRIKYLSGHVCQGNLTLIILETDV